MAQHQTSATPTNAEALRDIERVNFLQIFP